MQESLCYEAEKPFPWCRKASLAERKSTFHTSAATISHHNILYINKLYHFLKIALFAFRHAFGRKTVNI